MKLAVRIPPWSLAAAAVVGAMLLTACSKKEPEPEPIRSVKVVTLGQDVWNSEQEFSGEVRARVESRLGFRVAGKLVDRFVQVGQSVQSGQKLAQIDPQDYQLALQAAQAQVNAAKTQRDTAAADFQRFSELRKQNFISAAELDRRDSALKAAQAQLDQAEAQWAVQGNQAGYSKLIADASGVVVGVEAEVGQVVAAGQVVIRLALDGPRDVVIAVPEDQVKRFRQGDRYAVRLWGSEQPYSATVREVAASAEPMTRTFTVKLSLHVGKGEQDIPLGRTVYVQVPNTGAKGKVQVVKLPSSALRQNGASSAVWLLDEASMTVKSQNVVVASADANEVVIASGLAAGARVVTAGVHVLSEGQKVKIYQQKTPSELAIQESSATKNKANLVSTQ